MLVSNPVTGILVLEILVHGPKFSLESKLVCVEDARFTLSFLNRTQHDRSSTKGSLATFNTPGEVLSYCSGRPNQPRYRSS